MRVPEHLSHKPIVVVDNYHAKDGIHKNNTVAKGLSIGKSQWNENEISAKVWRRKEDTGWSRQSEELPLHRALDLAILILSIYDSSVEGRVTNTFLEETIINESGMNEIRAFLEEHEEVFQERIEELKRLLKLLD